MQVSFQSTTRGTRIILGLNTLQEKNIRLHVWQLVKEFNNRNNLQWVIESLLLAKLDKFSIVDHHKLQTKTIDSARHQSQAIISWTKHPQIFAQYL